MNEERINGSHYANNYNGIGSNLTNLTRSNVAAATPNTVVINDVTGLLSTTASLGVLNGGTGQTSFTVNNIIIGNGTINLLDSGVNITTVLTTLNSLTVYNKTFTHNSNNIIARELWVNSGATSVSVYAAAPPTVGQVLTATSATTATWQTPSGGGGGVTKLVIPLAMSPIYVSLFMQWKSAAWFPWKNSEYSTFTGGKIIFYLEAFGSGAHVRLYNITASLVIGSLITTTDGINEFSLTALPVADSKIELQVQKTINDLNQPIIYGVTMTLTI